MRISNWFHQFWPVYVLVVLGTGEALYSRESYRMVQHIPDGSTRQVRVNLVVEGKLKLNADGREVKTVPMSVHGDLLYDERSVSSSRSLRAVRHYRTAEAEILIGSTKLKPTLGMDHRLVALYVSDAEPVLTALAGPMTREELDLINVQCNSAMIGELLPETAQSVGNEWSHSQKTVAKLLGLEAVSQSDVTSKLTEVKPGAAVIEMSGSVHGATGGVATEIELKAKYNFDFQQRQITWFAVAIREHRSIGHAQPGLEVTAQLRMALKPTEHGEYLNKATMSKVPLDVKAGAGLLAYESATGGFYLLHDRRWQVMADQPQVTILRMVDRGDLVAQCNVSALGNLPAGQELAIEVFQNEIQQAIGDRFGQFLETSQSTSESGMRVLRVVAAGMVANLPIHWIYYHVSNEQGRRVSYVFTLEGKYAERFAGADQTLVNSLVFTRQRSVEAITSKSTPPANTANSSTTKQGETKQR